MTSTYSAHTNMDLDYVLRYNIHVTLVITSAPISELSPTE